MCDLGPLHDEIEPESVRGAQSQTAAPSYIYGGCTPGSLSRAYVVSFCWRSKEANHERDQGITEENIIECYDDSNRQQSNV